MTEAMDTVLKKHLRTDLDSKQLGWLRRIFVRDASSYMNDYKNNVPPPHLQQGEVEKLRKMMMTKRDQGLSKLPRATLVAIHRAFRDIMQKRNAERLRSSARYLDADKAAAIKSVLAHVSSAAMELHNFAEADEALLSFLDRRRLEGASDTLKNEARRAKQIVRSLHTKSVQRASAATLRGG